MVCTRAASYQPQLQYLSVQARQCHINGDDYGSAGAHSATTRDRGVLHAPRTAHWHLYTYLPDRGVCGRATCSRTPRRHCACPTPKQAQAQQSSPPLPRSCSTLSRLRIAHNDGQVSGAVVAAAILRLPPALLHSRDHRPLRISPHTTPAGTVQVRGVQSSSRWPPVTTLDTCDRTGRRPVCEDAFEACEDATAFRAALPALVRRLWLTLLPTQMSPRMPFTNVRQALSLPVRAA